jgi:hypothetical protein
MNAYQLNSPVTVSIADRPTLPNQPSPETREVTVSSLTLRQVIDDPIAKRVSVFFFETRFPVTIWEGATYDAIGNWTQEQLDAEISAALSSDASKFVIQALAFPAQPDEAERKAQADRMKAAFPHGFPRPAWVPTPTAPAPVSKK